MSLIGINYIQMYHKKLLYFWISNLCLILPVVNKVKGAVIVVIVCSWIYNYLCNQCLWPLTLWVWISLRRCVLDTTLCDKVCQWLAAGRWFSPGTPISSTNKSDRHDITDILLKVALNTIKPNQPKNQSIFIFIFYASWRL